MERFSPIEELNDFDHIIDYHGASKYIEDITLVDPLREQTGKFVVNLSYLELKRRIESFAKPRILVNP